MLIGLIRSKTLKRPDEGLFELEIIVPLETAIKTKSPVSYIQHQVSEHLAMCVNETSIPLNEGQWNVAFTREAQRLFGFPEILII